MGRSACGPTGRVLWDKVRGVRSSSISVETKKYKNQKETVYIYSFIFIESL